MFFVSLKVIFEQKRFREDNIKLILKVYKSRFVNFELQVRDYELVHFKNVIIDLVKLNIVSYDKTVKTKLNTILFLGFDGKSTEVGGKTNTVNNKLALPAQSIIP